MQFRKNFGLTFALFALSATSFIVTNWLGEVVWKAVLLYSASLLSVAGGIYQFRKARADYYLWRFAENRYQIAKQRAVTEKGALGRAQIEDPEKPKTPAITDTTIQNNTNILPPKQTLMGTVLALMFYDIRRLHYDR